MPLRTAVGESRRARREAPLTTSGETEPTLVRLDGRGRITVPKEVRESLELDEGTSLMLRVVDDRMELVPMTLVPRDQGWFYRDRVQERLTEASRDMEAGRTEEIGSTSELRSHMDSLESGGAAER